MENEWLYKGKELKESLEGMYGFVYKIVFTGKYIPPKKRASLTYPVGTIYIGKKAFAYSKRSKLSKKAKLLPQNKGKRVLKTIKDSGWRDYYGSSIELKAFVEEVGKENFSREILHFCPTKAVNTYMEIKEQIEQKVLEVSSFNKWIGAKVWKYQLVTKI